MIEYPTAFDIKAFRDRTQCGLPAAKTALDRQAVTTAIEQVETIADVREVLAAMMKLI